MFALVKIRFCQIKYELKHLGIAHIAFLLALFVGLNTLLYDRFSNYPMYISLGILGLVLTQHFTRKDAIFVNKSLENPKIALFFDYVTLLFPFISIVLFTPFWYYFFLILIGVSLLSFLKTQPITADLRLRFLSRFIPVSAFEALSGGRKNYTIFSLLAFYSAAVCLCWVRGLPLFLLWGITIGINVFFSEYEPLTMLRKDETLDAQQFMQAKLKRYILPMLLFYTPILILNGLFQPDLWWVSVLFLVFQMLSLALSILYKYATYQPKGYFNTGSPVVIITGLCIVLPFLMPVVLFLTVRYYPKAIRNLNHYL